MLETLIEYYRKSDGKSEKDTELQRMSSPFSTTLLSTIFFSQGNKKPYKQLTYRVLLMFVWLSR